MKITTGTLFLVVAVFLDFIELISSTAPVERTLEQLFPGYNGALPSIRIFTHPEERAHTVLEKVYNRFMVHPMECPLLSMDHVVFGWKGADTRPNAERGDYIQPLWKLFRGLSNQNHLVFDSSEDKWVILPADEFNKLGFGRIWRIVYARQVVAAGTNGNSGSRLVNHYAHNHAYVEANRAVDELEPTETEKIRLGRSTIHDSCLLITGTYKRVYNTVFGNHVGNTHFGWSN